MTLKPPRFALAALVAAAVLAAAALAVPGNTAAQAATAPSGPTTGTETTPTATAAPTTIDYDPDGDGLADIATLDQLNAIRWDLNGDGAVDAGVSAADAAKFSAAWQNAAASLGCPDTDDADANPGPCKGYELANSLDFDANDDGEVTSADDYPNWTPIAPYNSTAPYEGAYTARLKGNNYTISNLTITDSGGLHRIGLFGALSPTAVVEGVGLADVKIDFSLPRPNAGTVAGALAGVNRGVVRSSYATGSIDIDGALIGVYVGGLVGVHHGGAIQASWAGVDVDCSYTSNNGNGIGGLAGRISSGGQAQNASITASYSTGSVSAFDSNHHVRAGGLVGYIKSKGTSTTLVTASYATGATSAATASSVKSAVYAGGLTGAVTGSAAVSSSYWNADTTGIADDADASAPEGKTASQLQSPTGYTGIYANWNIDIDNADGDNNASTGKDDPWDFGTNSQYPRLKFGGMSLAAQTSPTDYDADDDGLIDIKTLAQLNAVRYDLNGDGDAASDDEANYAAAFPYRDASADSRMGCPSGACKGYELMNSLDFDTDGSGAVTAADDYPNWTPIGGLAGGYAGTFKGNNNTISNLTISSSAARVGLFGQASGTITGVFLTDASVTATASTRIAAGALVGATTGTVRGCSATGTLSHTGTGSFNDVGGLAGRGDGPTISASWSGVSVSTAGAASSAGGLVGRTSSSVIATYATGAASASGRNGEAGGLVGRLDHGGGVTASYARGAVAASGSGGRADGVFSVAARRDYGASHSYWDTAASGVADDPDSASQEGKTTAQLQTPMGYTGIYADWNVNVDGAAGADDPWNFGAATEYPVLKYREP